MFRPIESAGRRAGLALALAVLAGCAQAPVAPPPTLDIPSAYAEADGRWSQAAPRDDADRGPWWRQFGDPELDDLEARVDVSSPTLQKSLADLASARAVLGAARAGWWPSVDAEAGLSRDRVSRNVVGRSLAGKTTNDESLGLGASWEPDLFGRIGAQVDVARASAQASVADVEAVRLALDAELASDYFALRENEATKRLLERTVVDDTRVTAIADNQVRAGYASPSDAAVAQGELERVRAQALDLDAEHARLAHAIATLIGVPASRLAIPEPTTQAIVPEIPAGLPSQLLERRPDIAAAERRVAAANAQVGVARTAYFPNLVLSLFGGVESTPVNRLLSLPSGVWSLGPSLAAPLFDGGRRAADLKGAQARRDASVAVYRQTVIGAINEVEDHLAALRTWGDEDAGRERAAAASTLVVRQMQSRFEAGAIDYLAVSVADNQALADQRALIALRGRRLQASVALLKALGGGWSASLDSVAGPA